MVNLMEVNKSFRMEEIKIEENNIYINVFADRNNVCRKPYI